MNQEVPKGPRKRSWDHYEPTNEPWRESGRSLNEPPKKPRGMKEERYESLNHPWKRDEGNYPGSSGVAWGWDNRDRYDSRRLGGGDRDESFRESRRRSWDYHGPTNEPRGWNGGNRDENSNGLWKRNEDRYEPLDDPWGRSEWDRAGPSNAALMWDGRNRYESPNPRRWGDRSREESLTKPPTGPSGEGSRGRNETSDRLWGHGGGDRDEPSGGPWGQGGRNHDEPSNKRLKWAGKSSLEPSNAPGSTRPKPPANDHGGFNNDRSSRREHLKGNGWGKVAGWSTRLTGSKQSPAQMRFLWGEALEILGGLNPDLIQNVVDRLVDRNNIGRLYIEQVVSHDYPSSSDTDYLATAIPFLLFMIHPEITNSLSIDRQVGTLYNYLYGTNGAKAVQFFENLAKQLNDERDTTNRTSGAWSSVLLGKPSSFSKALASTVECFRHTLRRNQNAGFNEAFKTCAEAFCALANLVPPHDDYYAIIDASLKEVIGIHRQANLVIERPAPLPASRYNQDNHTISSFPIEIDFPGYLADSGARHDNDHAIFREIQLFPTLDEIKSERKDYLPFKDTSRPHFLQGVDRLLDTHFRLLRHDSVAALKEAVWVVSNLLKLPERQRNAAFQSATRKTIQCFLYIDAQVTTSKFDKMRGLEIGLSFLQPQPVIDKSPKEQTKWWEEHKRFEKGSLACLVSSGEDINRVTFLTTCKKETKPGAKDGLANGKYGNIYVQLAETQKQDEDIQFLLGQVSSPSKPTTQVLLEFPGILPATFIPVLKNLQDLSQSGTLPLSQWIAPTPENIIMDPTTTTITTTGHMDNPPPAYSRNAEFFWDLEPILTNPSKKFFLSSTSQPEDSQILDSLETMTRLDRGQCKALITGLTKEMSLIQGPPGTGKSYVGVQLVRVLVHNKRRTGIGPIVCVCYTNHALDQFLEHLMQEGIDKIIRIGGQSKSKELEGKSLQTVARVANKTRSEGKAMSAHHENLSSIQEDAENSCKKLFESLNSWSAVQEILQRELPTLYRQFDISSPKRSKYSVWNQWRPRDGCDKPAFKTETQHERSMEGIFECEDIWSLSKAERIKLVEYLSQRVVDTSTASLAVLAQGHAKEISGLNAQHHEVDRRCLNQADVIGITTTGLAKNVKLLKRLSSKVVICEEAGEVLEGHLINAILPTCQHLIQIGDHEQLRPQINTYDLSLESIRGKPFRLDESMFERLVNEKALSPAQLNIQRRMRPEISNLVRNTLYPELQDHNLTKEYPDVVAMRQNMFWLDHSHPETGVDDSQARSHSNDWEVEMTYGLVRHLVRQGHYDSKDIAVLTPYTGQLQKLRRELRASFEVILNDRDEKALAQENLIDEVEPKSDINQFALKRSNLMDVLRVATVDNFQGEEAKIVIISLVRSNWGRKIGFLKTSNRINVLLSRAKHGMYIIGNSETAGLIPMWRDVCMMLRDANAIGNALGLVCPRHRETPIQIKEPGDFLRLSPEGGCDLPCNKRFDRCGHRCFSKCHSDGMHKVATCAQPCDILHPTCRHRCQKICSDECGSCRMPVYNFPLPCGHFLEQIECWQTQSTEVIRCTKSLIKTAPRCGHAVKVECWVDMSNVDYKCPTICKSDLTCGHSCTKTCGTCLTVVYGEDRVDHGTCKKFCGRKFTTCNHTCMKPCHDGTPCSLCDRICQVKCEHSSCSKGCRESCAPCAESCVWKCKHQGQCLMPCSAPCERFPCDERCDRKLPCGHRCPSVCGEICPGVEFCQLCCTEERKGDSGVDMLEFSPYSSIDLDKSPILVLSCRHFFTRETLDGYLELQKAYSMDDNGNYTGFVDPEGKLDEQVPKCPTCRQPFMLYTVRRYGRVVNRAAIMEMTKRFLASTFSQYKELADASSEAEKNIYETRDDFLNAMSSPEPRDIQKRKYELLGARLEPLVTIRKKLSKFVTDVDKQQQPASKLYEMTVARKLPLKSPQTQITATLYFRPDTRMELLAKILQTRSAVLQIKELSLLAHHLTSVAKATNAVNLTIFVNKILKDSRATINTAVTNCRILIRSAKKQNLPGPEVELLVIFAKLAAIWRQLPQEILSFNNALTNAVKEATENLDHAEKLCEREFTGVENLKEAIEAARKQLYNDATFYQDVSQDELQSVVRAMKAELTTWTPTGHWYYCQNGHPFTIDLCGQPMEETICPECGAPVGGNDHRPVAGMQSAVALEAIANAKSED